VTVGSRGEGDVRLVDLEGFGHQVLVHQLEERLGGIEDAFGGPLPLPTPGRGGVGLAVSVAGTSIAN
jgi:hypothetical protein